MNAVEIVMIPLSWEMNQEAKIVAQARGHMDDIRARWAAEQDAAKTQVAHLMDQGYAHVSSHVFQGANRTVLAMVLYLAPYHREQQHIPLSDRLPF